MSIKGFFGISLISIVYIIIFSHGPVRAAHASHTILLDSSSVRLQGPEGTFQMAVTVEQPMTAQEVSPNSSSPGPKKVQKTKSETTSKTRKKAKKSKVQQARSNSSKTKTPKEKEEEPGFFSKTLDKLMGEDDPPAKTKKGKDRKEGNNEEDGFLTKTLKTLVGEDEDDEKKKEKSVDKKRGKTQNTVNPLEIAPTVSATNASKDEKEQPKTAKSETKATLKESLQTIIGVDAAKEKAKAEDPAVKAAAKETTPKPTPLEKILDENKQKSSPAVAKAKGATASGSAQKAKAEAPGSGPVGVIGSKVPDKAPTTAPQKTAEKKEAPQVQRTAGSNKALLEESKSVEAEQLEKDRGGVKAGKNLLKESFKALVKEKPAAE